MPEFYVSSAAPRHRIVETSFRINDKFLRILCSATAGEYFEIGTPPAYGLYARKVRGLTLNNVRFQLEQPDHRPAVVLDHVTDVAMNGLTVHGNKDASSVLRFIDTQDALLTAARLLTPARVFL
jgi:hypothetical protein